MMHENHNGNMEKTMKKIMSTEEMKAMHKKEMKMDDMHPSKGMGKMGKK